ncbi:MAG: hypothetical protein KF816_11365 [Melioribacteraceae bacterium]|nr:hypothetical protein [Melioribacteraceae bacterium]
MAENIQELILKLTIDDKEYQAKIDVNKGKIVELVKVIDPIEQKFENTFKQITSELSKYNKATESSVDELMNWIRTQEISLDTLDKSIHKINEETKALDINHPAWQKNMAAAENLSSAKAKLIANYDNLGSAQKKIVPGQTQMNMAMSQFGYVLNDSQMFLVNFRMGLMGISNNIPMVVQLFNDARRAAATTGTTISQQLTAAFMGGGGLIIAINAVMLLLNILPGLFNDTTKAIEAQAEEVNKLREEYKNLSIEESRAQFESLQNRKLFLEAQTQYMMARAKIIQPATPSGEAQLVFSTKEDEDRYKKYSQELIETNQKIVIITNQLNTSEERLKSIINKTFDLSTPNNVSAALNILNTEIDNLADKEKRNALIQLRENLQKLKDTMTGKEDKKYEKFLDNKEGLATDIFKDELIEQARLELVGKSYVELLGMKTEAQNRYEEHLKTFHAIKNQTEYEGWKFVKEVMEKNLEMMKKAFEEEEKTADEAAAKATANRKKRADAKDKWEEERKKFNREAQHKFESDPYAQRTKELDAEEAISIERAIKYAATEEQITNIKAFYSQQRLMIEQQASLQQLSIVSGMLNSLAGLFSRHTAAYKTLAVTAVMIETYKGMAAASSPPPIGVGPMLAPFYSGIIFARGVAQATNIMKQNTDMKGFAQGGILPEGKAGFFEGTHREIVAPEKDFITVVNDLVKQSSIQINGGLGGNLSGDNTLLREITKLNSNFEKYSNRPAIAVFDNDTARAVGDYYDYDMRREH